MIIISVILILVALLYLYGRTKYSNTRATYKKKEYYVSPVELVQTEKYHGNKINNREVLKKRSIPRKTYLVGSLCGKYWGELTAVNETPYEHEQFYSFNIYEADVYIRSSHNCTCVSTAKPECSGLHTESEGAFSDESNAVFPKEKLPQLLPIVVKKEGKEYAVNIHQPQLTGAKFIARLHQTEGKEVFGTIEANITGFLLDYTTEEYLVIETDSEPYIKPIAVAASVPPVQKERSYTPLHYPRSGRYSTYSSLAPNDGCVSSVLGIMAIAVWATFFIAILPQFAVILPFIALPLLFRLIPAAVWKWSVSAIGAIMIIAVFFAIFNTTKHPVLVTADKLKADTLIRTQINDSTITHHLRWVNYDGRKYQGNISISRSALQAATQFKTSLPVSGNTMQSYDEMIYRLKEHDKNDLSGVYVLFDSIRSAQHLKVDKFAELIVSFIQDIPYSIVLPQACNASLYSDKFIRSYLATPHAKCEGFQRFGINTPIEFMASLHGDCDTRTLLLYTILSHYKYDVALLSSEYYNHSLIGVYLPYSGAAYTSGAKNIFFGKLRPRISGQGFYLMKFQI